MNDDLVEDFLHELEGWERAYPLSMFPEPDLAKAAELLKAGGMTLGAISASNMRHVVSQIAPKARAAISAVEAATPPVTGEVGELVEELKSLVDCGCLDGRLTAVSRAAAMLERYAAENARLSKCASCGEPLSRDCQTCRRDWAS